VRFLEITAVKAGVHISVCEERGQEPHVSGLASLELTGTMDEFVRDTRDARIVLYAADNPKPRTRPPLGGRWSSAFAHSCAHRRSPLTGSSTGFGHSRCQGLLKHGRISITPPRYQSADVLNVSFSTHPEE
jgi:hypothetical protein